MKLIKIGRSSQCNLVLPSQKVSSLHAEMKLMDNGEIFLTDKQSTNGTFVGGNRIDPDVEVKIQRGDKVVFADTTLSWNSIPDMVKENAKYKKVYNIGKSYDNDIRLTDEYCSRYHAQLRVTKDNKFYIVDVGSKNGTKVNGMLVSPNKEHRIKRGDNVMCANEDITEEINKIIPSLPIAKICIAVACVAAVIACAFCLPKIIKPVHVNPLEEAIKKEGPSVLRPATVYVRSYFHYIVKIKDCPISSDIWDGEMPLNILGENGCLMGTAFFVDSTGTMVTNRHITKPWDKAYYSMFDKDIDKLLRQKVDMFMDNALDLVLISDGQGGLTTVSEGLLNNYGYGEYWPYINAIYQDAARKNQSGQGSLLGLIQNDIKSLRNAHYEIDGEMDYITVGYPGRYYTHTDEFERCNVLGESEDENIDLGILQLNTKKTPSDIKYVFDINYLREEELTPLQDKLFTIGYPHGELVGLDENSKSLEPAIRETKCSKEPSRYTFDFQESSVGGSSGSPVFDEKGRLCGVLTGGDGSGATQAVLAKYVKELYDKVK